MPDTGYIETDPSFRPETEPDYAANAALFTADIMCDTRPIQALAAAKKIIESPDYHSWKLAGAVAAIGISDKADGVLARWAAKRLGTETTADGAKKDQLNDKIWTHIMLGSLASRAFIDGDKRFGTFMAMNQSVIASRDLAITKKREEATKQGVDAKAQPLGKYKTFTQNLTFTAACSPFAKTRLGKKLVYSLQTTSTGLSVASGASLISSLDYEMGNTQEPEAGKAVI